MASGDVTVFDQFKNDLGEKLMDMNTDQFKIGLVTSVATPTAASPIPTWGAGGTTNFATNEVTPGGNYSVGGPALGTPTWSAPAAGIVTWDAVDVSILQNAGNPTDARWGIIYNEDEAINKCVGYVDLGVDRDLTSGNFTITWNVSGIFTLKTVGQ